MIHSAIPQLFTYDSTGAYPITVCNALSQCSYNGFDFNTGLLTSFTDANGSKAGDPLHTTTHTYDSMLRPLCTNTPDGGQTCLSYPDSNTVKKTVNITSSLSDASSTILDSLGRPSQAQHVMPGGTAKVDTKYDPVGAVAGVSNPYFSSSDPTYGINQDFHDALGRAVETIRQDGSISNVQYAANCTTATDEAGKSRRNCHNAFGETIEVDEPQATSVGTSATASITVSGSLQTVPSGGGNPPLAATNTPLISFVASDGSSHAFYLDTHQHIWHLFWNSIASWQNQDLTAITGNLPAAANTSLSSVFDSSGNTHVFYLDGNQHVHELFCCFWQDHDLTAMTGNTLAVAGTALTSEVSSSGNPVHLYYLGTNQHVYHLYISVNTGNWVNEDLTAESGNTLAAVGSALSNVLDSNGGTHVFYLDTNQHINQSALRSGPVLGQSGPDGNDRQHPGRASH